MRKRPQKLLVPFLCELDVEGGMLRIAKYFGEFGPYRLVAVVGPCVFTPLSERGEVRPLFDHLMVLYGRTGDCGSWEREKLAVY